MVSKDLPTIVGNLFLLITVISAFTCLIRNDYNFGFALFFYYLWTTKRDNDTTLMLFVGSLVLIIADISWFVVVGGVWKSEVEDSRFWASMQGSYSFVILMSALSVMAKGAVVGLLHMIRQKPEEYANLISNYNQDHN